jgi:hypothetical protein
MVWLRQARVRLAQWAQAIIFVVHLTIGVFRMIDINSIKKEAQATIAKEQAEKAKTALVAALRKRAAAAQVVRNIDAEIADLEASIADGSFN